MGREPLVRYRQHGTRADSHRVPYALRMLTFDDFDAWGDAVSGAHLRLACDAVESRTWTLGILDLGDLVLQLATEGGGNLCYGGNAHAGPLLFMPLTRAAEHVVNGMPLDEEALFAIPHGTDFSIRVRRRAHAWCSVALPAGFPLPIDTKAGSTGLPCRPGSVAGLRRLVTRIAAALLERPAGTAAHRAARAELLAAVAACLPATPPWPTCSPGAASGSSAASRAATAPTSANCPPPRSLVPGPDLPRRQPPPRRRRGPRSMPARPVIAASPTSASVPGSGTATSLITSPAVVSTYNSPLSSSPKPSGARPPRVEKPRASGRCRTGWSPGCHSDHCGRWCRRCRFAGSTTFGFAPLIRYS